MGKKCGHTGPCTCKDTYLGTPPTPPCGEGVDCPEAETCSELMDAHCIVYQGDPIVDLDINPGDRLDEIIQKLALASTNLGCVLASATCQSVLNLGTISKTSTTITVGWSAAVGATGYQVEYKLASAMTFTLNPVTTNLQDVIGGLTPDTDYHVRVRTQCASGSCYSLTILIKTNE